MHAIAIAAALGFVINAAPPADKASADKAVKEIRAEYENVGSAMKKRSLRVAKLTLGGGQNPTDFEVGYAGVSEREAMKDPYASSFHLRRVTQHKVLPAVGDASVEYTFSKDGKLLFAFCTGVDISGAPGFNDSPRSETRVYFADDETAFRLVTVGDEGDATIELASAPAEDKARMATKGAALVKHAHELQTALATLAR